ncbi:MAG: hypothetical protein EA426_15695 [Spirochaetaceae bacterium]|nr:MAG: hypothetical protein EA426_15695 [Spirochaetaceae bacterium]
MFTSSPTFPSLRKEIAELTIIDCHEHVTGRFKTGDIVTFLLGSYLEHDAISAVGEKTVDRVCDTSIGLADRFPDFERIWKTIRFAGYGIGTRRALAHVFGSDEPTLANLTEWQKRLPDFSESTRFDAMVVDSRIETSISDNWPAIPEIAAGAYRPLPWQRIAISVPQFHRITRRADIEPFEDAIGSTVTSLDEYIELCGEIFLRWKNCGAVCLKDQSAYTRSIAYRMPARDEAERLFNAILDDPRRAIEYDPAGSALSDYLMHAFMRFARKLDLPVQLHTGHMAGMRNDLVKTNAAGLRSLLEIHRDVRFDIFHANWPYLGDLLFLGKNYDNVALDMCWAYAIDPMYGKETLKRALLTIPANKVHGFGSDVGGDVPHLIYGYSEVARDVIAAALSELIDEKVISAADAFELAVMWLYDNPKRFFRLE